MNFVVDNQTPVKASEKGEMWEVILGGLIYGSRRLTFGIGPTVGQYLVSADCNWAYFFAVSGVFTDHLRRDICLVNDFLYPLSYCNSIGCEDQCSTLDICHRC